MIKRIGHVGILVSNIDEALKVYSDLLGLEKPQVQIIPNDGIKDAIVKVGEQAFEVMEPLPDTPAGAGLAKFLEQRGEGLHHINIEVDNLDAFLDSLVAKGGRVIGRGPAGAFVHPKSTKGVLIEVRQAR